MTATKTVLVTGATGFLGRTIVPALAEAGWQITRGSRSAAEPLAKRLFALISRSPQRFSLWQSRLASMPLCISVRALARLAKLKQSCLCQTYWQRAAWLILPVFGMHG